MNSIEHQYDGRDLEVLANMERYQSWIVEQFLPYLKGEIIEYGAGAGNISVLLARHTERLHLVEPSPNLVCRLKTRFSGSPKIAVHATMLERHLAEQPDASTDGIVLVNVLEHVEDDALALSSMFRVLKPGGHLMLFVPALKFLMSPLDLHYGHRRRYHRRDLLQKVQAGGFDVVRSRYMDVLGIFAWLFVHKLARRKQFNSRMTLAYDRFFVPATRRIEAAIKPRIGKSLVLIARKRDN